MAEDNLFSPDDDGLTSSTAEPHRAAQDSAGEDGDGKTGFEANLFQRPLIDAAAAYVQLCQNPAQDWTAWLAEIDQQQPPPLDTGESSPTAGSIDAFLKLCQNPAEDWQAWLDDTSLSPQGGLHDDHGDTAEFHQDALLQLQIGLDAHHGRQAVDRLLFRQAADRSSLDELRPLRSATDQTELTAPAPIDAPPIDAEAMRARRFAMLQRFIRAARFTLSQFPTWRSRRRGKGKIKGRSTGGGQAAQLRQQQNRSSKKEAQLTARLTPPRPSNLLKAIGNAAVAIGQRQLRVIEYRIRARFNPFHNWGGAPMRIYRQQRSAIRRVDFAARVSRNFWRDLHRPKF